MDSGLLPILLFIAASSALAIGMLGVGSLIGPRRRLAIGDRHAQDQVRPFALEQLVLLHFDEAVAIARRAAVGARLAVTGQPHAHAIVDPGGNRHVELGAILDLTAAATVGARISYDGAGALAGGASR